MGRSGFLNKSNTFTYPNGMLRIFLTSSHLSTFFMTLHARKTHRPGYTDLLLIDHFPKKRSLVKLIRETAMLHTGFTVVDLSTPLDDTANLKPSLKKQFTRTLKSKPVFNLIYRSLYKREVERAAQRNLDLLNQRLQLPPFDKAELYLLAETALNDALKRKFRGAAINYMEHGLPDYYFFEKNKQENAHFYCAFSGAFGAYLTKTKNDNSRVHPCFAPGEFPAASTEFLERHSPAESALQLCRPGGSYALVLLQPLEQYNVEAGFWPGFLEKCIAAAGGLSNHTFIIKPHPNQSNEVIAGIGDYFSKKNLKHVVLSDAALTNTSIEVLFALWKSQVTHVFSPFSAAIFYLALLYPGTGTEYYYSYKYMKGHLGRAPEQFKKMFLAHETLINEVFAGNCREV